MTDAYLRFPHLHADLITFVAEDDVWLAPVDGGRAWRLSADQVPVTNPRFSPDGAAIAWSSTRDVEPEVLVAPVGGGASDRLTFWGDVNTAVVGWTGDGRVAAKSSTGRASIRATWAYAVPLDGAPAERLPYGPLASLSLAPDGGVVLGTPISREPAWWKRYRGGTIGKVWVDRAGTGGFERILSDVDGHIVCPLWVGGRIAFLSDHEGVGNVYSCEPDGTDVRKHSDHSGFYARNASTDGTRVVYHRAGEIWLLDGLDAEPRLVDVKLGGPRGSRQVYPVNVGRNIGWAGPDRTGRASAVEVRGTVHWVTHRDGPVRALSVEPGVRARLPQVLGTTGQAVWVTDADGEDALEFGPVDGREPGVNPRRVATGELGRVLELAASPDGRRVAVVSHDGRLLLVDTDDGEVREIIKATEADPSGLTFSPDSAWLAWSHPGPDPLRHIKMVNTTSLTVVDVTPLRFVDSDPAFTLDGKHLAFLSSRSFDPIYDVHVFDVSFANGSRPYLAPLAALTPSPFAPVREGRAFGGAEDKADKDTDSDDRTPRTAVDLEGITDRVVAFPVPAARYSRLIAVKGGVAWLRDPLTGSLGDDLDDSGAAAPRSVLERYDLAKLKADILVDGLDAVWPSGDGSRIVVRDGRSLRVLPADRKADNDDHSEDNITVNLSRVRVRVDPAAEWRQSFDESGRLMRDHFWRADMNAVDWAGVLGTYRPLVDAIGSHDDLVDLLWEVNGELGTSHAYVTPVRGYGDSRRRLGLLGADLDRDGDGVWRISAIVPGETSDPRARSPLRAPGVGVRDGDAIVAVDGIPVDPLRGPATLLVGTAGNPVELTVEPKGGGATRRVVVVPLLDDMPLRYQAWVNDRRAHVHAATDGKIGYLHVPDMVANGWAQFHRDLRLEMRRGGVVVDLRENRGGHLSQLIVEKLSRRIVGWVRARDGYYEETYPVDAPRGPVVAVANEFSGSDGDIVNAAIKALGIGPVVGTRTWGGVVGVDMRYRLVDGTLVTQPRYATWMEGTGWGMENHGVDPDVEVVMTPQDHVAGRDPQLDAAIEIAMERLAAKPAATPPAIPPLR
ncbi:S41 family peptidase [Actinokineospora globicatena]|uniref:S41 family peptidase n=1 Tax=Actinokineospora globicatena TaxID=103729 RepID=UPI0020A54D99|nr:S41 family peptidase [Actinokineospora globicatena]MCP2300618.1 tricorn protease [Actinokineospora globicatena]GLW81162.1 tricorn protease [Actinokineospora globicatena]GLW88355.1 tricorn protease [Actinokineospora globicatena]